MQREASGCPLPGVVSGSTGFVTSHSQFIGGIGWFASAPTAITACKL